jgi:hypothetical protein
MTSVRAFVCSARAGAIALFALLAVCVDAQAQSDPLPSWNDGPAKQAIVDLVKATTDKASPNFVPPEARIATFDQDGTTWVSHPNVHSGRLLPGAGSGDGEGEARTKKRRAVQDRALR